MGMIGLVSQPSSVRLLSSVVAADKCPDTAPLRSVFGVGPVTALTFVLTLANRSVLLAAAMCVVT